MRSFRVLALACCIGLLVASAMPQDDGLGKGKGKGGGGGSGGNNSGGQANPPKPPPKDDDRKPTAPPRPRDERPPANNGGGNDNTIGKPRGGSGGSKGSGGSGGTTIGGGQSQSGNGGIITFPPQRSDDRGRNDSRRDDSRRDDPRRDDGTLQGGKGRESRSGRVQYGTVSNSASRERPTTIDRAPIDIRNGSLQYQVRRQERVTVTVPYRNGYVHYDRSWRDDDFWYPYYSFTPVYDRCVVSPWYYYPHLPGYIIINRIQPINLNAWRWQGNRYNWQRNGWGNVWGSNDLDYALEDLVEAFERRDSRALGRLIPRRGRVNIAMEGQFAYSLEVDDFYDMLSDAMWSTRTSRYSIEDVRTWRGSAQVLARHDYNDPWGRRTTVYHFIRLEEERGGYVIRDFGTSSYRW